MTNRAARRRLVRSGGIRQEAVGKAHVQALPKPPAGEHQWTVVAMYRVADPAADNQNLDLENLLTIEGPGCYLCEVTWSPAAAARPCPGEVYRP